MTSTLKNKSTIYVNHSGGAKGSDSAWDFIGRKYDITDHRHYWHRGLPKPPLGNVELTDEQIEEGWVKVLLANKKLKRKPDAYKSLLARNWFQVKNADAVFAIGSIVINKGSHTSHTSFVSLLCENIPNEVAGGTGWAVQMAIDAEKPVFVFDQDRNIWLQWKKFHFGPCTLPKLTQNYAGIGTRNINDDGKKAIEEIYKTKEK